MRFIKPLVALTSILLAISTISQAQHPTTGSRPGTHNGPFGFYKGMTQQEVLSLLGSSNVKIKSPERITAYTAPKPHHEFEMYYLYFAPKHGLLKIIALGKSTQGDAGGEEVRSRFESLKNALTNSYGDSEDQDYLKRGSMWKRPQDFMMSLYKEERVYESTWKPQNKPNNIDFIRLSIVGEGPSKGYLRLSYELEGWDDYVDARDKQDDSNL